MALLQILDRHWKCLTTFGNFQVKYKLPFTFKRNIFPGTDFKDAWKRKKKITLFEKNWPGLYNADKIHIIQVQGYPCQHFHFDFECLVWVEWKKQAE